VTREGRGSIDIRKKDTNQLRLRRGSLFLLKRSTVKIAGFKKRKMPPTQKKFLKGEKSFVLEGRGRRYKALWGLFEGGGRLMRPQRRGREAR